MMAWLAVIESSHVLAVEDDHCWPEGGWEQRKSCSRSAPGEAPDTQSVGVAYPLAKRFGSEPPVGEHSVSAIHVVGGKAVALAGRCAVAGNTVLSAWRCAAG